MSPLVTKLNAFFFLFTQIFMSFLEEAEQLSYLCNWWAELKSYTRKHMCFFEQGLNMLLAPDGGSMSTVLCTVLSVVAGCTHFKQWAAISPIMIERNIINSNHQVKPQKLLCNLASTGRLIVILPKKFNHLVVWWWRWRDDGGLSNTMGQNLKQIKINMISMLIKPFSDPWCSGLLTVYLCAVILHFKGASKLKQSQHNVPHRITELIHWRVQDFFFNLSLLVLNLYLTQVTLVYFILSLVVKDFKCLINQPNPLPWSPW